MWLLQGETRVPFDYLRFIFWFYLHESMMYREMNLKGHLKLVGVASEDTAVRVSLSSARET